MTVSLIVVVSDKDDELGGSPVLGTLDRDSWPGLGVRLDHALLHQMWSAVHGFQPWVGEADDTTHG